MSGHSKWSQIKHKKAAADQKKGQVFSKLSRQITLAAKEGGPDPTANFKLRLLMDLGKQEAMPKDNIERAIEKAAGITADELVHLTYEGFGPAGTAFIVEVATDNKNRTASDIRHIFEKNGGSLGQPNSVAWNFESKGQILAENPKTSTTDLEMAAIEAGAEDVKESEEGLEIYTAPLDLNQVKELLESKGAKIVSAEVTMEAKNKIELKAENEKEAFQKLFDALSEHDDVLSVYTSIEA
jgi:YebC/PmpR family DNA-binding regulatory protein